MKISKRNAIIPISILICVLGLSIAYAAITGVLTFNGTAVVSSGADVVFTNVAFDPAATTSSDSFVLSADGKTIDFEVYVDALNNVSILNTQVENVGTVPVILSTIEVAEPPPAGLMVTWPTYSGILLAPGELSTLSPVTVELSTATPMTTPGSYNFSATLTYSEAP